jgi:hypothetical protein
MTSFGDAARLSASSLDQLGAGLSRLLPNQSGSVGLSALLNQIRPHSQIQNQTTGYSNQY